MAAQNKLALVTGATGTIGPALIRRLLNKGYRVRVLLRSPPLPGSLPESVSQFLADITDSHTVNRAVRGVDVVFHLAAKVHTSDPSSSLQAEYERVNVQGTQCVTDAAQAADVRRLVFFSTISVYGPSQPPEVLDESSPLRPQSLYAQTKCEAEEIVLSARQGKKKGPLAVVLRLAAVYGPHVKGNYARLIAALRRGWFVPLGDGCNRRTLIYDEDVSRAALLAAERAEAAGQIYNVTDGHIHTLRDVLGAICRALDKSPPKYYCPAAPVRVLAGAIEDVFRSVGIRPPVNRALVNKLVEDVAVGGDKIRKELEFRSEFALTQGWHRSLRER